MNEVLIMMNEVCRALDICSTDDNLAPVLESEFAAEFGEKKHDQLRVFWYPAGTPEPQQNFTDSKRSAAAKYNNSEVLSVQESMKALLLSVRLKSRKDRHMFVQFWTPKKTLSGRIRLSVLGQPVGVEIMHSGFLSYRYMCMKKEILVGDRNCGPVGRAFDRGYPEYSSDITSYSREEFPMMDYAKFCISYMALPVFEKGTPKKACIGVLEFLSTRPKSLAYSDILKQLESFYFEFPSHPWNCLKINDNLIRGALQYLRTEHKIPLVQIWSPCYCGQTNNVTKLFCRWSSSSRWKRSIQGSLFLNLEDKIYYVHNRKGVVGRAFSQKKVCYYEDTSKFSISDYPLVHLTRSSGLTACLAIPVQKINPRLYDVVVEVFLPPRKCRDRDYVGGLLKSLLSAMADNRHGYVPFQLPRDKEYHVQYSHSDAENYVYFDVSEIHRCVSRGASQKKGNDLDHGNHAAPPNKVEVDEIHDGVQVQSLGILESGRKVKQQLSNPNQPPATMGISDSNVETLRRPANFTENLEGSPRKRKEVHEIEPEKGTKRARADEGKGSNAAGGAEEIPRGHRMIVKATYKDDLVKFFLWSSSVIEELQKELYKRFKLEAEKFKVKYKDDEGNWVLLTCAEDLHFHLETSKVPEQTGLELLVLPLTD